MSQSILENEDKYSRQEDRDSFPTEKRAIDQLGPGLAQAAFLLNVLIFVGRYLWIILACLVVMNLSLAASDFATEKFGWAIVNLGFAALGARFLFLVIVRGHRTVNRATASTENTSEPSVN